MDWTTRGCSFHPTLLYFQSSDWQTAALFSYRKRLGLVSQEGWDDLVVPKSVQHHGTGTPLATSPYIFRCDTTLFCLATDQWCSEGRTCHHSFLSLTWQRTTQSTFTSPPLNLPGWYPKQHASGLTHLTLVCLYLSYMTLFMRTKRWSPTC